MIIVHVVEPFATGINTFIHELVFGMPDYEHVIVHGERKDTREIATIKKEYKGKATFIKWNCAQRDISFIKDFRATWQLHRILKGIKFDILHLHSSKAGVIGRFLGAFNGYQNIIYTPNGASFLRKDISKGKVKFYERIEAFFSRFNGRIISSSESEYKAYDEIGIQSKIIQNGALVQPIANGTKDKNTFKIVTCGKITIQKNPAFLNEIAAFFKDKPEITFKWIGDGELKDVLTHVEITGWCSKEEVYRHLNEADLYISTSSWEGLPLAGIEAMAFKLPLLMHDCVGNNDLVNTGINGYIFDTKIKAIEDIEYLKEKPNLLNSLGNNSLKMYNRHYSNFRCAKEYDDLYKAFHRKTKIATSQ